MTCLEALEYISRALDNDLNEEEISELEKHIEECETCRREYEDMQAVFKDIKNEQQYQLPPSFHEDLMKKINESKVVAFKAPTKKNNYKKYAALAASFLVLAVVGISSGSLKFAGNTSAADMEMASPSAGAEMDMVAEAEEAVEAEAPMASAPAAPMEEAPRMMMASAADDVTSQETVEDEMGMAVYEEPKENAKFSMAHTANEDGTMPESAEEEMAAYDGDMINALVLESDDEKSVLKALEKYAEENGFDVGVGGNKIVIYGNRDISAEVKELIGSMAQIAEDDAVEGTEYNVVEIEIR